MINNNNDSTFKCKSLTGDTKLMILNVDLFATSFFYTAILT